MKAELAPGLEFTHTYIVPQSKTVPHIYEESPELADFPQVFATGFMVALMEWACIKALDPYLDDGEGSLGVQICVSHDAPTPPGFTVTVHTKLTAVEKRRLTWEVTAHDGVHQIGHGTHERAVIHLDRFKQKVAQKAAAAS